MGIDIRDGQQLECITCALCIDACDDVMNRIGVDKGLISYTTLAGYNQNIVLAGGKANEYTIENIFDPKKVRDKDGGLLSKFVIVNWRTILRPRTWLYMGVYSLIGIAMLTVLALRDRLELNVLQDRNPVYVVLSDGSIRNGYEIKILNMLALPRKVLLRIEGLEQASIKFAGGEALPGLRTYIDVKPDQLLAVKLFVQVPGRFLDSVTTKFKIIVSDIDEGGETSEYSASFMSPQGSNK